MEFPVVFFDDFFKQVTPFKVFVFPEQILRQNLNFFNFTFDSIFNFITKCCEMEITKYYLQAFFILFQLCSYSMLSLFK